MQQVARSQVTTEWALWVESGGGTHAVLMDRADGTTVWVETTPGVAASYERQYGPMRVARIVADPPASTVVYTVGHNLGGYLPDPDSVSVAVTSADARAILASDLDRLADALADQLDADNDTEELDSVAATVELVEHDTDGDVTWALDTRGAWSVVADGYTYWVERVTLGDVYGDDTDSVEYADTVAALLEARPYLGV